MNEAAFAMPVAGAQGRSRPFPEDRRVVHGPWRPGRRIPGYFVNPHEWGWARERREGGREVPEWGWSHKEVRL